MNGANLSEQKCSIEKRQRVGDKKGERCDDRSRMFEVALRALKRLIDEQCAKRAESLNKRVVEAQSTRQNETICGCEMLGERFDDQLGEKPSI